MNWSRRGGRRHLGVVVFLSVLAFLLGPSPSSATSPSDRQSVSLAIEAREIYVPESLGDQEEAVVVLDGSMPDSCYKLAGYSIHYAVATRTYEITQMARRLSGTCLPMTVPYSVDVHLGRLPAGQYRVAAKGAKTVQLIIEDADAEGPDLEQFAPVETARIDWDPVFGIYLTELSGRFSNSCMTIGDVEVLGSGPTIEVWPFLAMTQGTEPCREADIPFNWVARLPIELAVGRHLLHTKSMSGKSVNQMFTVEHPATSH